MRTIEQINEIKNGLCEIVERDLLAYKEVCDSKVLKIQDTNVSDALDTISDLLAGIYNIMLAPQVSGVGLPDFIVKVETRDSDVLKRIKLIVKSKLKSRVHYKNEISITIDENLIDDLGSSILKSVVELYYLEQANENIDILNYRLKEICEDNDIPFRFKFALTENSSTILSINNSMVTFGADLNRALNIASSGLFQCGNEYNDLISRYAYSELVNALKSCQTTTQLIKCNMQLIKDITGITTKKRANKLIRESYHRNAQYLDKVKQGIGYFEDTVIIDDEEVKVFALIEKDALGNYMVILNPFDTNTLFDVDVDVLSILGFNN